MSKNKPSTQAAAAAAAPEVETPAIVLEPVPLRKMAIVDNILVEAVSNRYFHGFSAVAGLPGIEIEKVAPQFGCTPFLPKLTFDEWKQIVSFHRWSVATYSAETHISTLLTADGQYIHCPFHQAIRRGAMTVNVDYTTPDNIAILEQFQSELGINTGDFHASTHNHVRAGAFASGTDKDDETFKQGWHFTIGNCDQKKVSIDGRVRVKFNPRWDDEGRVMVRASSNLIQISDWANWVDIPHVHPDMPDAMRKDAALFWLTTCPDEGFPEEWKSYITETKTVYGGHGHGQGPVGYQNRQQWQGRTSQQQQWNAEDWNANGSRKANGTVENAASTVPAKKLASIPADRASRRGHILAYGAVSEEAVAENLNGISISREMYREYRVEISILDMLATHGLTLSDALTITGSIKNGTHLALYTSEGTTIARAAKAILDSEDFAAVAAACVNLEDLFRLCPGYMVSQAVSECPHNRRLLLGSFMKDTSDV